MDAPVIIEAALNGGTPKARNPNVMRRLRAGETWRKLARRPRELSVNRPSARDGGER